MAKTDQMHLRIDPALKAELIAEAQRRHIDMAALVTLILAGWVARNREAVVDVLDDAVQKHRTE